MFKTRPAIPRLGNGTVGVSGQLAQGLAAEESLSDAELTLAENLTKRNRRRAMLIPDHGLNGANGRCVQPLVVEVSTQEIDVRRAQEKLKLKQKRVTQIRVPSGEDGLTGVLAVSHVVKVPR